MKKCNGSKPSPPLQPNIHSPPSCRLVSRLPAAGGMMRRHNDGPAFCLSFLFSSTPFLRKKPFVVIAHTDTIKMANTNYKCSPAGFAVWGVDGVGGKCLTAESLVTA